MKMFCDLPLETLKSHADCKVSKSNTVVNSLSTFRKACRLEIRLDQQSESGGCKPGYSLSVTLVLAAIVPRQWPHYAIAKSLIFRFKLALDGSEV
jgi:hypothetical protein